MVAGAAVSLRLTEGPRAGDDAPSGESRPDAPPGRAGAGASADDFQLRTWAAVNELPSYDPEPAAAVADAERFDLLTALRPTYAGEVGAMRAANPDLQLLVYMNGSYATRVQEFTYPEDWYARDASGLKVRSQRFGAFLMDPSHPGWVADRARTCANFIAESGYGGCFVDDLGAGSLFASVVTGQPINPATGSEWTTAEWLEATAGIAAAVKREVGPAPVIGNGLGDGGRYFSSEAPTSRLLDILDGGIAEGWLRQGMAPLDDQPSEGEWLENVDLLVDADRNDKTVLTLTKTWGEGTLEQKQRWYDFTLASFLLGAGEDAHFAFSFDPASPPTGVTHPTDLDLGAPRGVYTRRDGVYQRDFTRGRVLVNPSPLPGAVDLARRVGDPQGRSRERASRAPMGARLRPPPRPARPGAGDPRPPPSPQRPPPAIGTAHRGRPPDG